MSARQVVFTRMRDHLLRHGPDATSLLGGQLVAIDLGDRDLIQEVETVIECGADFLTELQDIPAMHHPALWRPNLERFAEKWGIKWEPEPEGVCL